MKRVIELTSNCRGILLLPTTYKILYNILFSRLSPYIDKITGVHLCGFQCIKLTTNQIFCIHQILEKKWESNGTMHQLFVDFEKAYDSVKREVLHKIVTEFGISVEQIRTIKVCLNKTCSKVHIGKNLSDAFLFQMV